MPRGDTVWKGAGVNIIYIDDDATNRALLREMLSLEGIEMVEAADAISGLKMIENGKFDLIFMDLRMPDMNGLTAIRQLRSGGANSQNVPIIVVTADPSEGIRTLCRTAGATDFLDKPISMERLFDIIASVRKNASGKGGKAGLTTVKPA